MEAETCGEVGIGAPRSQKRQAKGFLPGFPEGVGLCQHSDFSPVIQILDFWLPKL